MSTVYWRKYDSNKCLYNYDNYKNRACEMVCSMHVRFLSYVKAYDFFFTFRICIASRARTFHNAESHCVLFTGYE